MSFSFQIYHYDVSMAESRAYEHSWIRVEHTANEKELSITLLEFRESKLVLKCEVLVDREIAGDTSIFSKDKEV